MKNTIIALAAAGTLAAALPSPAQAHCRGCGVAAGVVGGLAAGAIIGSAIANSRPPSMSSRRRSMRAPPPAYVGPPDVCRRPVCHIERQQVWDGYGLPHAPRRGLRLTSHRMRHPRKRESRR